jgi:hypothetical protein
MAEEPEYKLDNSVTERDLLFRIARELTTLRKQTTEMISYLRDAESEVSEKMRRFIMYAHDVHDIMNMYTEQGYGNPYIQLISGVHRYQANATSIANTDTPDGHHFAALLTSVSGHNGTIQSCTLITTPFPS